MEENNKDSTKKTNSELDDLLKRVKSHAERKLEVLSECKFEVNKEEYLESFKTDMMPLIKKWYDGCSFTELMEGTAIYEGTAIRIIRRLDELLKQLIDCCNIISNKHLASLAEAASAKIKRGIAFSASLYLNC